MIAKLVDKGLDLLWDALGPVAGNCPVCAFIRGVLVGMVIVGFVTFLRHSVP